MCVVETCSRVSQEDPYFLYKLALAMKPEAVNHMMLSPYNI